MATSTNRSLWFAWLTLAGVPGDLWCAATHLCVDGHLHHADMPLWWGYADFVWITAFVAAAVVVLRSDVPDRLVPFGLLCFVVFSRVILGSCGGGLLLLELPALLGLTGMALFTIVRVREQKPLNAAPNPPTSEAPLLD